MAEYIIKPDYTMLSKKSHGNIYKWNFGTDTEPERIVRCRNCKYAQWKAKDIEGDDIFKCKSFKHDVGQDGFCARGEPKQ